MTRLTGAKELLKKFGDIKQAAANKIMRKAVAAGSRVVAKAAKQRVKPGLLRKAIGQKVKVYRNSGAVVGIVGVRSGFEKNGQNPRKYAHIIEGGRNAVMVKRRMVLSDGTTIFGKRVRAVSPRPFIRPAVDANISAIRAAMQEVAASELAKAAR